MDRGQWKGEFPKEIRVSARRRKIMIPIRILTSISIVTLRFVYAILVPPDGSIFKFINIIM